MKLHIFKFQALLVKHTECKCMTSPHFCFFGPSKKCSWMGLLQGIGLPSRYRGMSSNSQADPIRISIYGHLWLQNDDGNITPDSWLQHGSPKTNQWYPGALTPSLRTRLSWKGVFFIFSWGCVAAPSESVKLFFDEAQNANRCSSYSYVSQTSLVKQELSNKAKLAWCHLFHIPNILYTLTLSNAYRLLLIETERQQTWAQAPAVTFLQRLCKFIVRSGVRSSNILK